MLWHFVLLSKYAAFCHLHLYLKNFTLRPVHADLTKKTTKKKLFACNRWQALFVLDVGLCFLVIDREITSRLSTLDRQPFVDAIVTEELSVFSSQTNFLNTA